MTMVIMTMIGSWSHAHCRGIAALQQLATPTAPIVHCAHHGDDDDDGGDDDYHDDHDDNAAICNSFLF